MTHERLLLGISKGGNLLKTYLYSPNNFNVSVFVHCCHIPSNDNTEYIITTSCSVQMHIKGFQARTFSSFLQTFLRRTYPEWNQPLGSMQASVFSLSSQYPSMTLYPRKQISPAVLMGTTRPCSSTIFALKNRRRKSE